MEGIFVCNRQIDRINGTRKEKEKHVCRVGIGEKGKDRYDEKEKIDTKKSVKEKEIYQKNSQRREKKKI